MSIKIIFPGKGSLISHPLEIWKDEMSPVRGFSNFEVSKCSKYSLLERKVRVPLEIYTYIAMKMNFWFQYQDEIPIFHFIQSCLQGNLPEI